MSVAIKASTGKAYNPDLTLNKEPIPYLGDSTFHFLGAPVTIHSTAAETRNNLVTKLSFMLQKVDDVPITRQQKLKLFRICICPHLTWNLSISDLPMSWLCSTLQPIATRFLKKWSGLARPGDPNRLFLPKSNSGLDIPPLVTCTKRSKLLKAGSHMYSSDSTIQAIATQDPSRVPTPATIIPPPPGGGECNEGRSWGLQEEGDLSSQGQDPG